jgi:hypothetical protein
MALKHLPLILTAVGACLTVTGATILAGPVALVVAGVITTAAGLFVDFRVAK